MTGDKNYPDKVETPSQEFIELEGANKEEAEGKGENGATCEGVCSGDDWDDGFNWEKYGHKEIHGSKQPSGYYRWTQHLSQGCLATKQVQQTDEDPTQFDVIYHGAHTCHDEEDLLDMSVASICRRSKPSDDFI
nr:probable WRKY transcription factor 54 [Setaria viridis]